MQLKKVIITELMLLIIGAHSNTMYAQEAGIQKMTLHDCMEYAVSNSTQMRISKADRNDEQAMRRQAILEVFTPSINAETNAYNQYGRNLDPETNTYKSVTTFHNGYSVSANITLFDGLQSINNMRIAKTTAKMGLSKEQQTCDKICLATMEAFYNYTYYNMMEDVLAEQVTTAKAALQRAQREEELGRKNHADVVQMESELAQKEYQHTEVCNKMSDAMITLKDVMFWPAEDTLSVDCDIIEPRMQAANAEEMIALSQTTLPSAQIAQANLRNAELGLKAAKGAYMPTLRFSAGWSTSYYTYPGMKDYKAPAFGTQFRNNAGEYIQLHLSIPIYDKFKRRTAVKQKANAVTRAKAELDQRMRDIENEVCRAVNDSRGAEASFRSADKLAMLQDEAFRLSQRQYEMGIISAIEYQTASQNFLNAKAERLNNLLKWKLTNAIVRYYNGESYINQR